MLGVVRHVVTHTEVDDVLNPKNAIEDDLPKKKRGRPKKKPNSEAQPTNSENIVNQNITQKKYDLRNKKSQL